MSAYLSTVQVETLRKPSTGLKPAASVGLVSLLVGRDTQKTQHGIETIPESVSDALPTGRDTQKTQHGIETHKCVCHYSQWCWSRHSENPARD